MRDEDLNMQIEHKGSKDIDTRRYIVGIFAVLIISLLFFYFLMNPPMSDIGLMTVYLSLTAVLSIVAGFIAYKYGFIERSPTIAWTILGGYILSSLLTFFIVWLSARLMFASQHDLLLATVLLIFASGIAISFGFFFAKTFTNRIKELEYAARKFAEGNFAYRVNFQGNDELAGLAVSINSMAEELLDANQRKQEIDNLRRDLVAWTSHDLQTPIASVRAIIEALVDGVVEDKATQVRYLHTAQKDIQSLSIMIDDLFQLAQLDAGGLQLDLESGSISDLVSDTIESFHEIAEKKQIYIEGQVIGQVDPVLFDTIKIGRVLRNLISNAVQYSHYHGEISVKVIRKDNGVHVSVIDNGQGINAEDIDLIFDRFYRGDRSRNRSSGGSGLGLAIAKGFVEAHGGKIGVVSQRDEGAEFWFWLPS